MARLPDFIVIGAMKAGTTSLYRWLEATELVVGGAKEPQFFTENWTKGVEWYGSLFGAAPSNVVTGEASVAYTDPMHAEVAAARMSEVVPNARLVFVARHPLDRLRSHFRHEVQRNREHRPFSTAVADPTSSYVRRSLYGLAVSPYFERFDARQILVVEFDNLVRGDGFGRILSHLGLPAVEKPTEIYNATVTKPRYTPLALWLFERRLTRPLARLPAPVRRIGRFLGTRSNTSYKRALAESVSAEIPNEIVTRIANDARQFETITGLSFGWEFPR